VITGAASGIGRATALRLAREGAAIEILDIQEAVAVCDEIGSAGGTAHSALCDVTDEEQIQRAVNAIGERNSQVDILVNNAGILSDRKPWHTLSREEVERFAQTNYLGYFLVAKAVYPLLKKSKAGRIINVASRTFYLGNPGQMAYVASKGAVMGMTRVLAKELGADGITVNAVAPGLVATEGARAVWPEAAFDQRLDVQAIKKRVQPEHLASLIAFLAGDDAEMITGQWILCDGGGYLH
jgi:NAD(P)-dependent dehydrogenase (short-subunit alcohol dehydrogenase family)